MAESILTKIKNNSLIQHALVVVGFAVITMFFFSPIFFGGKQLSQGDIVAQEGAYKEIKEHREKHGEEALWTNSMFGGMPAYGISTVHGTNFVKQLEKPLRLILPYPFTYLFIAMLSFYLLMLILKTNPFLAIAGAIAFGLSSYNIQLYEAGHNTKLAAIAYMPMVLGAMILVFRKKYWQGGALFAFFLTMEVSANHVQITYYLGLMLVCVVIGFAVNFLKNGQAAHLVRSGLVLMAGVVLALACNASLLWTTYTYKDQTIRGKSELTNKNAAIDATSGLDKSYITQWSYGKGESFTFLVPNFKGGASGVLKENKKALSKVDRKYRKSIQGMDKYYGGQPFTSGPVYLGSVVCLLLIVGLYFYRGTLRIPLIAALALALLLSWGKNFMAFTDFFIEYMPLYNNFRAVSMTLVIVELAVPVLVVLGINELIKKDLSPKDIKAIWYTGGGVLALLMIFMAAPTSVNDFFKPADPLMENSVDEKERLTGELKNYNWPEKQIEGFLENVEIARKEVFLADVQRSFIFVAIGLGLLLAFAYKKLDKNYLLVGIILLVLIDLWSVDKRYLSDDHFTKKKRSNVTKSESKADLAVLTKETNKGRVLNLAVNTFNDASTSYFHQSIGGYSAVKLRRYQELYDHSLLQSINKMKQSGSAVGMINTFQESHTLNMLNMSDVIYNPNAPALNNEFAYGNAWICADAILAKNADEELDLTLSGVKTTAIISEQEKGNITESSYTVDSLSSIQRVFYAANELLYEVNLKNTSLIVFSEIFYKDGWLAYIDEQEVPIARANFILRALQVPEGQHKIRFEFKPTPFYTGRKISAGASLFILLLLIGVWYKNRKKTNDSDQAEIA